MAPPSFRKWRRENVGRNCKCVPRARRATLCCLAACGNSLFVERVGLLVGEHAAAGEKPQALRRLQREAMTTPRHHVDDELGVLPIAELVEIHVDRTTTDLTEILVVAADTELACRVAHRRRAVAAAA